MVKRARRDGLGAAVMSEVSGDAVRGFGQWAMLPKLAKDLKAPNRTEDAEQFARRSLSAAM